MALTAPLIRHRPDVEQNYIAKLQLNALSLKFLEHIISSNNTLIKKTIFMGRSWGGGGAGEVQVVCIPPGKSQVAISVLRSTDPLEKQLDPVGPRSIGTWVQLPLEAGRYVQPSVKYVDD